LPVWEDVIFFSSLLLCALCGLCGKNFLLLQLGGEWQQRDVARAFDRFAEPPLVARARARHAARQNFASILYEWLKHLDLLVVDEVHALDAEPANLLLAEVLALAAAARAARAATTRATGTAALAALASPSATGESFAAWRTAAGMPFGAVCAATGGPFRARRARSRRDSGCFW
jgi:hypothetical protein